MGQVVCFSRWDRRSFRAVNRPGRLRTQQRQATIRTGVPLRSPHPRLRSITQQHPKTEISKRPKHEHGTQRLCRLCVWHEERGRTKKGKGSL